ncbi:hypothetical protein IIA79_02010 [bacterium]|nr:hypothetical protein [bacterium]
MAIALALGQESPPVEEAQPGEVDWAQCIACHPSSGPEYPLSTDLRPAGLGTALPVSCGECHVIGELTGFHSDWRHPVRPVADHLSCTECHVALPHGADVAPPLPIGDYNAEGCYECHRGVEARRHMSMGHGDSPRTTCRGCHPAHEPMMAGLPAQLTPPGLREHWESSYDWWASNEDCLACHPTAWLFMPLNEGFVALDTVNYHDVHVTRGAVLCIECHLPHGGMRPAMLRTTLLTGELMTYMENSRGGTCAVRCHGVDHQDWSYVNQRD